MPKFSFYAVYPGWRPGVYRDWGRAQAASSGHPQDFNNHKGFRSWNDAVAWYLKKADMPPEYMEWYRVSVNEIPSKQIRIEEFSQQSILHIKILANGEQQTKEHIAWLGGAISSQDIGRWGEEYAFVALRRKLLENCHNEHPEVDVKEFQGGCVIHSGGQTLVEIRWTKKETNESPDIKVVVDGIDKYFEVKSTTSYNEMDVAISKTQWRLAEEKREQFCILRVCGVGTMRATVYEIWNPYELWLKGKLIVEDRTILPGSELQLPTNEVELGKPDATVIRREPQQRAAKSKADRGRYVEGIGKRKAATARVRLYTGGTGSIVINHKPGGEYFSRDGDLDKALEPLWLVHCDQMNISIVVKGGGMTGQADAIRLGIARALLKLDGNLRNQFRQKGFLTRDARVKERKKPGLKRARKAPQYTKR